MGLETVGYKVVVEGAQQATSQLTQFNKAVSSINKGALDLSSLKGPSNALTSLGSSASSSTNALKQLANVGFSQLTSKALGASPALSGAAQGLTAIGASSAAVLPVLGAAAVGLAAVTAGAAAFYALGKRGAALQPTIQAFGNIVGASNDANEVLGNLRTQTRGTIDDFELMRLTVASLKGTTNEFKGAVANDLGTIIDYTGRIAQASGDSADVVREKFLLGLRRQSKLLLDDVGVMVDAQKAYENYAKSAGIATSALTDQQKQAAYATEAIRQLKLIGEEIGGPQVALENLQKPLVAFQNVLNKLSLAVLPAFAPITQIIADISSGFEYVANRVLPLVQAAFQVTGAIFTEAWANVKFILDAVFGDLLRASETVFPYFVAVVQFAAEGAQIAIGAIADAVRGLASVFFSVFPSLSGITDQSVADLATRLTSGGANIIGSFAAGLLRGGTYVVQAVTAIAKIVADFLEGFSPPKKGPLTNIDKGGYNVAKAWADGFVKGALEPIEQVAKAVNDQLGDIGTLSAQGVALRLKSLETALQPFVDQLDIAKGLFEQVAGFIDPALEAADRQTKAALKAGDFNAVRTLDQQSEYLKNIQSAEQKRVDEAELQLALAKSQQAAELALLKIQEKRVGAVQSLSEAAGGGAGERAQAMAKEAAKTGKGEAAGATSAATPFTGGAAPNLLNLEGVDKARQVITQGLAQGLADSGFGEALSKFQGETGELNTQISRIAAANPGQKLSDKIAPATDAFNTISKTASNVKKGIDNALRDIDSLFTTYFGEGSNIFTLLTTLTSEGGLFSSTGGLGLAFTTLFGEGGTIPTLLTTFESTMSTFVNNLTFTLAAIPATLQDYLATPFTTAKDSIYAVLEELLGTFTQFAGSSLGLEALGASLTRVFVSPVIVAVNSVLEALENAIQGVFDGLPSLLKSGLTELGFDGGVSIPRISIPGAASGALKQRGLTMVGEKGPELVNFGKPANIFPAGLSRAIMGGMAQARPIPIMGGGGNSSATYNNQRTMNTTFNVDSPNQARLLERQRMAFGGF